MPQPAHRCAQNSAEHILSLSSKAYVTNSSTNEYTQVSRDIMNQQKTVGIKW